MRQSLGALDCCCTDIGFAMSSTFTPRDFSLSVFMTSLYYKSDIAEFSLSRKRNEIEVFSRLFFSNLDWLVESVSDKVVVRNTIFFLF